MMKDSVDKTRSSAINYVALVPVCVWHIDWLDKVQAAALPAW